MINENLSNDRNDASPYRIVYQPETIRESEGTWAVYNKQNVNYMLYYRFPLKLVVFSIIYLTLSNIALIVVQSVGVSYASPYYQFYTGFW